MSNYLTSEQIIEYTADVGVKKAESAQMKSFLLAFMGGLFIALASIGSLIATGSIQNFSASAIIAGVVFSTGLMMVVIGGGDLFTGNVLMVVAVLRGRTSAGKMLQNLLTAFMGNLAGAMFIVLLVHYSGLLDSGGGVVVQKLLLKASHKLELPFLQAFFLGILCNLLVCIAVWMMYSAKDTGGKVLACLFPIMLFILSGYEHIVANMYYIPAGLLAASNPEYLRIAGLNAEALTHFTIAGAAGNFVPVLLGNTVGGLIIGGFYSAIHSCKRIECIPGDVKGPVSGSSMGCQRDTVKKPREVGDHR